MEAREPHSLLTTLRGLTNAQPFAARSHRSWRDGVRIADVPLGELREFVALLKEARSEQEADDGPEPQQVSARRCTATWVDGHLTSLTADEDWLMTATRQAISDQFVEALAPPPPAESERPTASRDRLTRFMGAGR